MKRHYQLPMPSLYTFEHTDRLSDTYPVAAIRVHSAVGCGRTFKDVAAILEPSSVNPCLLLCKPLGVDGVESILNLLKQWVALLTKCGGKDQ